MSGDALDALRSCEDEVHEVPRLMAAIEALCLHSAERGVGLSAAECLGLYEVAKVTIEKTDVILRAWNCAWDRLLPHA